MSAAPTVKGWCPGARRPMMSGDGLIVRVRPFFARLEREQALGLCAAARAFGNGFIDLTNRANLQIRGVAEADHERLLGALDDLGLLDATPEREARRNIVVTPFWERGDLSHRITRELLEGLDQLPPLPAKFGLAVDAGAEPVLSETSADIRVEQARGGVMVRADGVARGRVVDPGNVTAAVAELAQWFMRHRTPEDRRMAQTAARVALPASWQITPRLSPGPRPDVGTHPLGALIGAAFGQIEAQTLERLLSDTGTPAVRVTPWRMILLEDVQTASDPDFVCSGGSPLLTAQACAGAPFCTSATVETRALARRLALETDRDVHVSGCAKSCASKQAADVTLIGRDGRFDLVRSGHAWDAPQKTGLTPDEITTELKTPA
ncbi:precorrin-3B synthase [Roseobacter sinensis]|uniref:Precorrin-3B synthase n=1 Tax=Roseobacter sinensis TaxID=2931391 RepID=A0ABT3BCS7_9RHOB|nr:precorrin-3B synthase [Roseobacter sp. WL0113]MCV3271378.1 precorrin-3B synthase [Roseobacter sp. WL0113]